MLDRETRNMIVDLVGLSERDVSVFADYSGRGMYGDTCFGISGDPFVMGLIVGRVAATGMEIETPRRDSLGLGVIWYWPGTNCEGISA